jgi:hypothetical protein
MGEVEVDRSGQLRRSSPRLPLPAVVVPMEAEGAEALFENECSTREVKSLHTNLAACGSLPEVILDRTDALSPGH